MGDMTPTRKVGMGGISGVALAPLIIWLWGMFMPANPIPPEAAASIGGVLSFVAAWLTAD